MPPIKRTATLFSLVIALGLGGGMAVWQLKDSPMGFSDFRAYWAAARLLLTGRSSYSPENMFEVERTYADPKQDFTMMAWNPPTTFVFLLPVAWLPFQIAKSIWVLVNIALLLSAGLLVSFVYLPPGKMPLLVFFLAVIFFPPALVAILMGQVTFLVLFGVAASIFLIRQNRFGWAGAALILTTVKPHLVLLVGPYLLSYMAAQRKWSGWLGLGAAGLVCALILFMLRPGWLTDFQTLLNAPPVNWATPTLGGFLAVYGVEPWPRYLGFGGLFFLPLFLQAQKAQFISFETVVSLLVVLTVPTTFFGWGYDQSLLLIPIAQMVGWLFGPLGTGQKITLALGMIGLNLGHLSHRIKTTSEVYYLWVPIAWGVLYGLGLWMQTTRPARPSAVHPPGVGMNHSGPKF